MSDENNNHVNDPTGSYQQPLTFDKVWLMFQETNQQFKETDKKFQETDKKFKETERIVKRLSKIASGLGINIGEATEDYFRSAMEHMPELAGIQIEKIDSLRRRTKKLQGQFDMVLFGKNTIVVVEVKHKLHPKDVVRFHDQSLPVFKQLYPEYSGYKILGAVAGMAFDESALAQAFEMGLLALTQSGQKISVLNPEGFQPNAF